MDEHDNGDLEGFLLGLLRSQEPEQAVVQGLEPIPGTSYAVGNAEGGWRVYSKWHDGATVRWTRHWFAEGTGDEAPMQFPVFATREDAIAEAIRLSPKRPAAPLHEPPPLQTNPDGTPIPQKWRVGERAPKPYADFEPIPVPHYAVRAVGDRYELWHLAESRDAMTGATTRSYIVEREPVSGRPYPFGTQEAAVYRANTEFVRRQDDEERRRKMERASETEAGVLCPDASWKNADWIRFSDPDSGLYGTHIPGDNRLHRERHEARPYPQGALQEARRFRRGPDERRWRSMPIHMEPPIAAWPVWRHLLWGDVAAKSILRCKDGPYGEVLWVYIASHEGGGVWVMTAKSYEALLLLIDDLEAGLAAPEALTYRKTLYVYLGDVDPVKAKGDDNRGERAQPRADDSGPRSGGARPNR